MRDVNQKGIIHQNNNTQLNAIFILLIFIFVLKLGLCLLE